MTTPNQNHVQQQIPNRTTLQSYAAHAVSTPHLITTPNVTHAPRSVPSPAVARSSKSALSTTPQTAANVGAKHPAASTPAFAHGFAQGGTPMAPSLSQMSNTSASSQPGGSGAIGLGVTNGLLGASPGNLLSFTSPTGMVGLDMMGTPSGMLGSDGVGGQVMGLSLSDLGLSSRRGNEDEERRGKLENVLAKLQGRKSSRDDVGNRKRGRFGRVSEEGVRRVVCWVGMEIELQDNKKEKKFEGDRQVYVAGKSAVMIDFSFKNNLPTQVDVNLVSENEAVIAHQQAASKVLLDDLTPPPGVAAINTKLDRFAANLETIAKLDQLSVSGQFNCFEAITGVYTSLLKLYEQEKAAALALSEAKQGDRETLAERETMCKRSGRPRMHARRKIGLSVEYWMSSSRFVAPGSPPSRSAGATEEGAMDVDTPSISEDADELNDAQDTYTLALTAEENDPNVYPSIRTSSSWISPRIHVPQDQTTSPAALLSGNPSIDWEDPPPTYLALDESVETTNQQNDHHHRGKLPSARFVAELDPPLVMPWNVANQILQSVGAQAGTDIDALQTYTSILLKGSVLSLSSNNAANNVGTLGGTTAAARAERSVLSRKRKRRDGETGEEREQSHRAELWVPKQEFGYVLRRIPFAHPRQILQILPVLRQWAQVGSLLRNTFINTPVPGSPERFSHSSVARAGGQYEELWPRKASQKPGEKKMFSLAELLTPPESPDGDVEMSDAEYEKKNQEKEEILAIDVSLTTTPTPALDIVFPLPSSSSGLASVSVGILGDGEVVVLGQNLVEAKDGKTDEEALGRKIRRLGKALEVVGDLGVWVEWLRGEFGESS